MAIWLEKIDLKHVWNHDEPWQTVRDNVIPILQTSKWYAKSTYVQFVVEGLKLAEDVEEFDNWWGLLYDEADADRVWIGTF